MNDEWNSVGVAALTRGNLFKLKSQQAYRQLIKLAEETEFSYFRYEMRQL
jgi:hypothetical protein